MVTLPLRQLCLESAKFQTKLFELLSPEEEVPHSRENQNEERERGRRREPSPVEDPDSDEEEDNIRVQPRRGGNRVQIATKEGEEDWSPALIVGAFFADTLNKDVLVDCGATCLLINPKLVSSILRQCP